MSFDNCSVIVFRFSHLHWKQPKWHLYHESRNLPWLTFPTLTHWPFLDSVPDYYVCLQANHITSACPFQKNIAEIAHIHTRDAKQILGSKPSNCCGSCTKTQRQNLYKCCIQHDQVLQSHWSHRRIVIVEIDTAHLRCIQLLSRKSCRKCEGQGPGDGLWDLKSHPTSSEHLGDKPLKPSNASDGDDAVVYTDAAGQVFCSTSSTSSTDECSLETADQRSRHRRNIQETLLQGQCDIVKIHVSLHTVVTMFNTGP